MSQAGFFSTESAGLSICGLFHSRTGVGVGVRNSLRMGMGVGANNLSGVDSGVDIYWLNFAFALASNTLVYKVFYRKYVYNMYI
jgi:hypothetical protein